MSNIDNTTQLKNKILILGGTGKSGRRVVERLNKKNIPVRIGSRSGKIPFDWNNPMTWEPALQNVTSVYIVYYPDLAVPGAVDAIRTFTTLAVKHNVQKLVLLSGRGEEEAQKCEQIVQQADTDWTIIRSSWFSQNFNEGFIHNMILSGEVALPAGFIKEPFVDVDDIADIAIAALTEEGHTGQLYEITGTRLLSFTDAVEEIAKETGLKVCYKQISIPEFTRTMTEQGIPNDMIDLMIYLFTTVLDGRNEQLTDGIQRALGRQPGDFSDFVQKSVASGSWQEPILHHA